MNNSKHSRHPIIGATWLITLVRQKSTTGIKRIRSRSLVRKSRKIGFNWPLIYIYIYIYIYTPLPPPSYNFFFFFLLFNSVHKKPFLGVKNIWWGIPNPQRYTYASNSLESDNLWQSQQSSMAIGVSK